MDESEFAHERQQFDRPDGVEVGSDWSPVARMCECGDTYVPERLNQIRCTYCTAVKQDVA